jgi:hypothetical protein
MGLPSCFLEKKFVKDEKGDDITPFDGTLSNLGKGKSVKSFPDGVQNVDEFNKLFYKTLHL